MSWEPTDTGVPRIPLGVWIEDGITWLKDNFEAFFDAISDGLEMMADGLAETLNSPQALVMIAVLSLLAWLLKDWKLALTSALGLLLIAGLDQWENAMQTLAVVVVATLVALVVGIPLGIWAARSERVSRGVRPVMDLMQTMPAFVWLVPVVFLFSIGVSGAVLSTIVFALPPCVRLTELGIRQVDTEVVEAGHAFGATPREILRGIQLPLALPTVMAGVNQVIMLALSMAVIAGLVGGGGLGGEVTSSIAVLDIGLGFEAGLSVVVLAIYLDRVTAAIGGGRRGSAGLVGRLRARRTRSSDPAVAGTHDPASVEDAVSPTR